MNKIDEQFFTEALEELENIERGEFLTYEEVFGDHKYSATETSSNQKVTLSKTKQPNPGHSEAIKLGCTCQVLDNNHGIGCGKDEKGQTRFWIREDCPIHGLVAQVETEKKDSLGDRMKADYENRTRFTLPRRTYTIIRLDGKAFHTYTRNLERPFDRKLIDDLKTAAIETCEEIQGAQFAYLQSDEISILLTDFKTITTEAWFDNNLQKMVSVAASIFTANFNLIRQLKFNSELAYFDARAFTIPDPIEVANYFVWRQKDWVRNSIQMAAQSVYSQKQLHGKNNEQMQEMLFMKGINWSKYAEDLKNGTIVSKEQGFQLGSQVWTFQPAPVFTQKPEFLLELIDRGKRID